MEGLKVTPDLRKRLRDRFGDGTCLFG